MDPITSTFLLKSGYSIGKSILNQAFGKPKRFEDTAQGKRLQRISQRGAITPGMRSEEIGDVSRAVGAAGSRQRTALRGQLVSRGLGNSIAGVRAQRQIGTGVQAQIGATARDITRRNEASKIAAKEQLAIGQTASNQARRDFTRQNILGAVSGVAQAGMDYTCHWSNCSFRNCTRNTYKHRS